MSHFALRKQANCLNCGTNTVGRYCHNCGQENVEAKESVAHFAVHFLNDFTHFDGKFFATLRYLLFQPGYLSKEYMEGKRVRYLNPIRMYLFTSFFFFLIFFSFSGVKLNIGTGIIDGKTREQIEKMSPAEFANFTSGFHKGQKMTREQFGKFADSIAPYRGLHFFKNRYKTMSAYDSALHSGSVKHSWWKQKILRKEIMFNARYTDNNGYKVLEKTLLHNFPQILFSSLPFAALILLLLYIRHKRFYYVSHIIFTLHFYIFVFIMMLVTIGVSKWETFAGWDWLGYINGLLTLIIFFYFYKAMRNFYQQRRGKTILKYLLFLISFTVLIFGLFTVFLVVSFFQV